MVEDAELEAWFSREVFPLERRLTRFISRNWRRQSEVLDLRQEVYARVYEAARVALPRQAAPFVFTVARNHLVSSARRSRIVSFDQVADLEGLDIAADLLTPERRVLAREELRRFEAGMDRLPARCREIVRLRKVDGLTTRETAGLLRLGRCFRPLHQPVRIAPPQTGWSSMTKRFPPSRLSSIFSLRKERSTVNMSAWGD